MADVQVHLGNLNVSIPKDIVVQVLYEASGWLCRRIDLVRVVSHNIHRDSATISKPRVGGRNARTEALETRARLQRRESWKCEPCHLRRRSRAWFAADNFARIRLYCGATVASRRFTLMPESIDSASEYAIIDANTPHLYGHIGDGCSRHFVTTSVFTFFADWAFKSNSS